MRLMKKYVRKELMMLKRLVYNTSLLIKVLKKQKLNWGLNNKKQKKIA